MVALVQAERHNVVKLILDKMDDFEQVSMLEYALIQADIPYEIAVQECDCGIRPPYLVVDGVPLDDNRAMKWIKEQRVV